jgi:3-oxoacyl-[acyl-carrier-protein] synthase II
MTHRRVVITGLGAVTSVGLGAEAFREALLRGASGISKITGFDTTGFPVERAGEVRGFDPSEWVRRLDPSKLGRSSQFSIAAARMALDDAGVGAESLSRERCGVSLGTTEGESRSEFKLVEQWVRSGPEELSPDVIRQTPADRIANSVAREFDLHGEAITLSTACAAGNYAIGHAYDLIRLGEADAMLCGGVDSLSRSALAGFYRVGAISPDVCRPFDLNRQGILTGEGAGVLFLESLDGARERGARVYAEVLGYGLNCDANHMTAPESGSIAACMRLAHSHAGIEAGDVDYICAHGTGTKLNDAVEAAAIREVFGDAPPPTSAIKSMIGHTMGAASALASVACTLALHHGFMPPTINLETPDPECGLDCVPNEARRAELNVVQNDGFAFGGNNSILILGRPR